MKEQLAHTCNVLTTVPAHNKGSMYVAIIRDLVVIFITPRCLPQLDEENVEDPDFISKEDTFGCVSILEALVPRATFPLPSRE